MGLVQANSGAFAFPVWFTWLENQVTIKKFCSQYNGTLIFYSFSKIPSAEQNGTSKVLPDFSRMRRWVVRLKALFPQLLRKQRTAGSFLAQTQPWQVLLTPVGLMEGTGNLILSVTGALAVVDSGCPAGIAVPPPLQKVV